MRLWTLHPKYLDSKGLVALWRESLLAKAVLDGQTKGYTNHPQLLRFCNHKSPLKAIDFYLKIVYTESVNRGYKFDSSKFDDVGQVGLVQTTSGQLEYEWKHLLSKLEKRDFELFSRYSMDFEPEPHPLFNIVSGPVEYWEVVYK